MHEYIYSHNLIVGHFDNLVVWISESYATAFDSIRSQCFQNRHFHIVLHFWAGIIFDKMSAMRLVADPEITTVAYEAAFQQGFTRCKHRDLEVILKPLIEALNLHCPKY